MTSTLPGIPGSLILDILGVRVAVEATRHDPVALGRLLAPIVVDASSNGSTAHGSSGAQCSVVVDSGEVEEIVGAALLAAIEHSGDLLVHAGAVALEGRAVLFPGASGTGKSTITAACLARGMGYLSDEAVAVDLVSGLVTGLSRPIMLTPWSRRALRLDDGHEARGEGKRAVPAERLGSTIVAGPLAVAHVVVVRHGAPVTAMMPMTPGEALTHVLAASFNHYRHGETAWEAVVRMAGSASGWYLDVADLETAADAVAELHRL